jgi:hypothetical protein
MGTHRTRTARPMVISAAARAALRKRRPAIRMPQPSRLPKAKQRAVTPALDSVLTQADH